MRFHEKAMVAFIVALIIACLIMGPRIIAVFFAVLLGAILTQARGYKADPRDPQR